MGGEDPQDSYLAIWRGRDIIGSPVVTPHSGSFQGITPVAATSSLSAQPRDVAGEKRCKTKRLFFRKSRIRTE
jgi:hypothetical protein